jgi:hypothetical protein
MNPMIHCVYFWLNDNLTDEQKRAFAEEGLTTLPEIDVVESGTFGVPASTPQRPVTDHSFDFWLMLRFRSIEDQNAYQIHPEHDAFVKRFGPWFKEVRVYDGTVR